MFPPTSSITNIYQFIADCHYLRFAMKISPINPSNTYGWQKPHKKEEDTEETTPDQRLPYIH